MLCTKYITNAVTLGSIVMSLVLTSLPPSINAQSYASDFDTGMDGPGAANMQFNVQRRQNNMPAILGGGVVGFVFSSMWSQFGKRRMKKKHKKELENIRRQVAIQLNNQNIIIENLKYSYLEKDAEITDLRQRMEQMQLEQEYGEFKLPDANNDDLVSRQEFLIYMEDFKRKNPQLNPAELPVFEDFDHDRNGLVRFDEWQEWLHHQQALMEQQGTAGGGAAGKGGAAAAAGRGGASAGARQYRGV